MAELETVLINTLEQVLSADMNRAQEKAGAHAQNLMLGIEGGVDDLATPSAHDVVLRGLACSVGAGLSVDISAGWLLQFQSGAPPADTSAYRFGVLSSATNLALAAADPVNPRIDRISASIVSTDSDPQVRNILTLPSRVVTPVLTNKTRTPLITLTVTTGVAGAAPSAPATPVGEVVLWDVFVPAAAAAVVADHMMDVRRYLQPAGLSRHHFRERGMILRGSGTDVLVGAGIGICDGARVLVDAEQTVAQASAAGVGEPAIATDQLWHVYVVPKGAGVPIGQNSSSGAIFALSTTAPSAGGFGPGAGISVNVLQGAAPAATANVLVASSALLYVGSIRTGPAVAQFTAEGCGTPLDRDGSRIASLLPDDAHNGWIHRPRFEWVSASSVRAHEGAYVLRGHHGRIAAPITADMTTHMASGEVEGADTWYYVYLRSRTAWSVGSPGSAAVRDTPVLVISAEAPFVSGLKNTPEAGFTSQDYLYVGSFYNNASSNIARFRKQGDTTLFLRPVTELTSRGLSGLDDNLSHTAGVPDATRKTVTCEVPETARIGIVKLNLSLLAAGAGEVIVVDHIYAETGAPAGEYFANLTARVSAGGVRYEHVPGVFHIPLSALGEFEMQNSSNTNVDVGTGGHSYQISELHGYVEDI